MPELLGAPQSLSGLGHNFAIDLSRGEGTQMSTSSRFGLMVYGSGNVLGGRLGR